ncbi:hypothetical protein ABDD95_14900 [Mucilaginibacter sp. PAMB04274]|uniref:hypothetical protein n=1 Tax=Mucilaginibacter sp. PAMB04274 TaxID=3138568 RepID=UPI0031F6BFDB
MTITNNLTTQPTQPASLGKRMLIGAAIALVLISVFLLGVKHTEPAWGKLWMVKPLIMVPLTGAAGGAFSFLMDKLRYQGGWKAALAIMLSVLGYVFALWIGTVLGLNGTLWN